MATLAIIVSIVSLVVALLNFVFSRLEFRKSGPRVAVELVTGNFAIVNNCVILISRRRENQVIEQFTGPLNFPDRWRDFSVYGVAARNFGRAAVTVRQVALKQEVEVPSN